MAPGVEASFALADGRVLEYWDGGDPAGRAVILHPGTPATRILGLWCHDAAVAAGVRLVSISRPGYGGSTMSAGAPSLLATGRDTASLAAHLGLQGYAVVGASGGGPFAIATAVADRDTVRALGVVGGVGPWRLLDPPSTAPEDRGCLALLDAGDVAGAWGCMHRAAEEDLGSLVEPGDAVDAILAGDLSPLIHDEAYRAVWADNMRVVLANLDGYTLDNLAWGGPWDVDPRDVVAPSLLWFGAVDEHCPPVHGQWYADRLAGSRLSVAPGEGHIDVIDAHWPEVLADLLRIWR